MKILRLSLITGLIISLFTIAIASQVKRTASISDIKGNVEVQMSIDSRWVEAKKGMVLNEGSVLRTRTASWVLLNVDGNGETATVELKENGQLRMAQLLEDKTSLTQTTLLDLALGEVLIKAKKLHSEKSKFEVKTPTSIVAVRGTTFSIAVKSVE